MEKKGSSIFLKNFLISVTVILLAIVLVLLGMSIEKSRNNDKKSDDTNKQKEVDKKETGDWTIHKTEERKDSIYGDPLFLMIEQDNDIADAKAFLDDEYYNDFIIFSALRGFFNEDYNRKVTKQEVLDKVKEMYGYDLDLEFHDIIDDLNGQVGYKWDEDTQTYSEEEAAFAHGGYFGYTKYNFYNYKIFDKNDEKDADGVHTVTFRVIWLNQSIAPEDRHLTPEYYATHNDVQNNTNEIMKFTEITSQEYEEVPVEDDDNEKYSGDSYAEKVYNYVYNNASDKIHTYEYKYVEEDGNVKILSYRMVK